MIKLFDKNRRYKILAFSLLIFCVHYAIAAQDTVKIIFFQDSNIQQFRGVEWHRIQKDFPAGSYEKAILKIDLGCATYGCCAWDYTYRGFFSKKISDSSYKDIEVARLITPYSSFMRKGRHGYDSTWVHPYFYDVTDYLPFFTVPILEDGMIKGNLDLNTRLLYTSSKEIHSEIPSMFCLHFKTTIAIKTPFR
jgi:hypothetical protein